MVNIDDPEYDGPRDHEGFTANRARISRQAGAERLGVSLWDVPPDQAAYPYHAHLTEEELVIVLEGTPSLRTPSGWRELEQGEVVSTSGEPDIVLQPDSGKLGAFERQPAGGGLRAWFRREDQVGYWEGECPPS